MPIGTPIYAARGGTVIEVASDFYDDGLDASVDGPRANVVRVLHDDGTMSLYAHLNWNSIRVVPGQRVERGEYLADSGNTGLQHGAALALRHAAQPRRRDRFRARRVRGRRRRPVTVRRRRALHGALIEAVPAPVALQCT